MGRYHSDPWRFAVVFFKVRRSIQGISEMWRSGESAVLQDVFAKCSVWKIIVQYNIIASDVQHCLRERRRYPNEPHELYVHVYVDINNKRHLAWTVDMHVAYTSMKFCLWEIAVLGYNVCARSWTGVVICTLKIRCHTAGNTFRICSSFIQDIHNMHINILLLQLILFYLICKVAENLTLMLQHLHLRRTALSLCLLCTSTAYQQTRIYILK